MAVTRPYRIRNKQNGDVRYVEAALPSQALRHVAQDVFDVSVPSALEMARLFGAGVVLEQAKEKE